MQDRASCHALQLPIIRGKIQTEWRAAVIPGKKSEGIGITPMESQISATSIPTGKWSPSPNVSVIVKRIHAMLHPRNIVLVGATDKPGNYAERIWNNLIKYKFEGGLYPVNARRETIWGVPCYKDFASLPDKPDHVLVLVPARFAVQVIRDAAAAGARSATIVTSGFSELQDAESQKLAGELQQAIRETGLAVTGPNCLGNLSAGENMFTTIDDRIVTMEAGPVAIAGQSGAIVMAIRQALEDRHHDRAGLTGDRNGAGFHRNDAVVDVGEQSFAGAQVTEAIWSGDGKAGLPDRLLQLGGEPLAVIVLQFAEARGHD